MHCSARHSYGSSHCKPMALPGSKHDNCRASQRVEDADREQSPARRDDERIGRGRTVGASPHASGCVRNRLGALVVSGDAQDLRHIGNNPQDIECIEKGDRDLGHWHGHSQMRSMFAAATMPVHLPTSAMMRALKSSGLNDRGSLPSFRSRSTTEGSCRMAAISLFSRSTSVIGMPAGPARPCQDVTTYSGTAVSEMVGISGKLKNRA